MTVHPLQAVLVPRPRRELAWRQVVALACLLGGAVALVVGWVGISDQVEVWQQMPYLLSGGIGGAALVAVGITAWVSHEHDLDRTRLDALEQRLQGRMDTLETSLAVEIDAVLATRRRR